MPKRLLRLMQTIQSSTINGYHISVIPQTVQDAVIKSKKKQLKNCIVNGTWAEF